MGSSGPGDAARISQKGADADRQLPTPAIGAMVVASRKPTAVRIHKPQADAAGGSLCAGGGAGRGMVSAGPVLPCGLLDTAGVLWVELVGMDKVESWSSVATQRPCIHIRSPEHGCPGGVCEHRHWTQDDLDAAGSAPGDKGLMRTLSIKATRSLGSTAAGTCVRSICWGRSGECRKMPELVEKRHSRSEERRVGKEC